MILSIIVGGLILYFIIRVIEKAQYNVQRKKELKEELTRLKSLNQSIKSGEEIKEEITRQFAKIEKEAKERERNKNKLGYLLRGRGGLS